MTFSHHKMYSLYFQRSRIFTNNLLSQSIQIQIMDAKRKVILFIISFAMIYSILTSPFLVNAPSIPVTIPVWKDPQGIAYDPGTGEMYVANFDSNTVSVISDSTNTVVATIEVPASHQGRLRPDRKKSFMLPLARFE